MTTAEKIQQVIDNRKAIQEQTPSGLNLLRSVYYDVFHEYYPQGCGPCHKTAYLKLTKVLTNKKFIPMSEKKYILKDGHQVSVFGSPEIYTNDNLTDSKAEKLLKERPALAGSFKVINGELVAAATHTDETVDVKTKASASAGKKASTPTAKELIDQITAASTVEEVLQIAGKDIRKTVIEAKEKRTAELAAAAHSDETHVISQEDLDGDPELAKQGFKVGDKVKIEEDPE